MKTCTTCQSEFEPKRMGQNQCSPKCMRTQKENDRTKKQNKKPKKLQTKLSTLQTKADDLMSEYIRRKYADEHGYVSCVVCGRMFRWQEVDCGHFVSRRHFATRYTEENAHPECRYDNRFNHDHLIGYTQYMIEMYGKDGVKELQDESKKVLTPSQKRAIVTEAIEYYTQKIKGLNHEQNNSI